MFEQHQLAGWREEGGGEWMNFYETKTADFTLYIFSTHKVNGQKVRRMGDSQVLRKNNVCETQL